MKHVSAERKRLSRVEMQEETRRALLDAALALFIERGVEATSIEHVTAHAGYTRGAFYSNFTSKEELFLHTARHFFDGLSAASGRDAEDTASTADARKRIANIRQLGNNDASIFIAEMCLYGYRHPEVREAVGHLHQEQLQMSISYLERVVRAGGLDPETLPVTIPVLAQLMQATIFALHLAELIDVEALRADDGAAAFTELMTRALG